MTLPAAGWFADPQDTTRLRWWDGRTWGNATRALPMRLEAIAPVVVAPVGPSFSIGTGAVRASRPTSWTTSVPGEHRVCATALVAAIAAVISALVNPLGLCSLVALVAGLIAIAMPAATGGWRVLSRSTAVSALVVAVGTGLVAATAQFHLF